MTAAYGSRPGINATLDTILAADRRVVLCGEDVGVPGGLARRHGQARVFATVRDEQSILGLGRGRVWRG